MAQAIAELLLDDRLWQQFAQNGREFILSNYSWPKTITTMTRMLQKAAD
jgi:glycosyltransferase involved in cell wall biosynthesis